MAGLLLLLLFGFLLLLLLVSVFLFEKTAQQEIMLGRLHVLIQFLAAGLQVLHRAADIRREDGVVQQFAEGALTALDVGRDVRQVARDDRRVVGGGLQAGHDGIGLYRRDGSDQIAIDDRRLTGCTCCYSNDLITHQSFGANTSPGVFFYESLYLFLDDHVDLYGGVCHEADGIDRAYVDAAKPYITTVLQSADRTEQCVDMPPGTKFG